MPIPILLPVYSPQQSSPLVLVPRGNRRFASFARRGLAHCLDLCFLSGFSASGSQLLSLLFLRWHMPLAELQSKAGLELAQKSLLYGQGRIFFAGFLFLSLWYFLVLPAWSGRTLGLGLLGCRVVTVRGENPGLGASGLRFAVWLLHLFSGGLLLWSGLGRGSVLLQDRASATRVVRD